MELYERLLYLHQHPARIAASFAYDLRHNPDASRPQIPAALAALLQARAQYQGQAEEIEREQREGVAPWADFGGTPTPAQLDAWHTQGDKEAEEIQRRIRAIIAALDALFCEICHALDAEGLTLTGGQISALKREALPDALAEELEAIKREHLASIPEGERLEDASAAALYEELTRQGLISGPYAAFAHHLGQFTHHLGQFTKERRKAPGEGLKWTGNKAEFAYFARRFAEHTQRGGMGQPYIREKALCRAFGFDDRQRVNTIRPYLSQQHTPRTSARIEAAFAAAWRAGEEARASSTGKPGEAPGLGASTPK